MFSMSTVFNPVYLAAAYLDCSRKNMEDLNPNFIGSFPDSINGHPWYHFVDPDIDEKQLQFTSDCLYEEL